VPEPRDDIELMQHFDGELPGGDAPTAEQRVKLEALAQVREAVRAHAEVATDEVEDRLAALWGGIERRIQANGRAAAATPSRGRARGEDVGVFTAIGRWLDRYRGHVLTGAVCAGAAAALVIVLRSPDVVTRERIVQVPAQPTYVSSEPAVVESLDVAGGSGTILTIPGEEGENPTTVIWVTRDDVEGPI
jgi:hypothetical protein